MSKTSQVWRVRGLGLVDCELRRHKVDKNIGIFAAQFMRPTRDPHLDAVSNEHRP